MNNFNKRGSFKKGRRGGFGGEGGGFKEKRGKGVFRGGFDKDREDRPITMHQAVCASCGKTCEIPFKPTGDKPVYCRDCFAGRMAMGGDRSNRRDPRKNNYSNRDNSFGNRENSHRDSSSSFKSNNEEIKRQIDNLNIKIDRLADIVSKLIDSK